MDKSGYSLPRECIHLVPSNLSGPAFRSLQMACAGGQNTFTVTCLDDQTLEGRASMGAQVMRHVVRAGSLDVGKLLADEIAFSGRDTTFEAALDAVF
jgi:hypothetical protein